MDERWRTLIRVRDLRAQRALNEVMRERRAQARAQAALAQARIQQTQLEEQGARALGLLADRSCATGEAVYEAVQARALLDFAVAARLKAQQAAVAVRRAKLLCEHTQERVDEANAAYRREAGRQEAIHSQWQAQIRVARRRQDEREDADRAEERSSSHIARRLRGSDPYGDEE